MSEEKLITEQDLKLAALKYAYDVYKERIERWVKANGATPPPFYWDSKLNEFIWMNRGQRRRNK